MAKTEELEEYYNKFCEENRFNSRHGKIEYIITMKYIREYLEKLGDKSAIRILDIGAGTGRYSIPLAEDGYDVTAIDLSPNNVGIMKKKSSLVKASRGNALDLKKHKDNTYDFTLLFGPMYHLISDEDKLKALTEAKRVTKPGGIIMVAYIMNEYAILTYAFTERHILENLKDGKISADFHTLQTDDDLYDFVRLEDIDRLNTQADLTRLKIFSPDGPANHMRQIINRLTEEEYEQFINYQLSVCERPDLLGASAHTVDVLKK